MKKFISNLLLATVFFLLLFILFVYAILPMITNQGETVNVPDVSTMQPEAAANVLRQNNLNHKIEDSVFEEELQAKAIVSQYPEPGDKVKVNREIDLVINKEIPPTVDMPELINKSFELARHNLESAGLELGKVIYKPFYVDSLVINQLQEGQLVPAGTRVHLTTAIDLVVGYQSEKSILMPDLRGMSLDEVKNKLEQNELILNTPKDTYGVVLRQYPRANTSINKGSLVEVIMD